MQSIPYRELSAPTPFAYSALFQDYLARVPEVKPFFARHFSDNKAWRSLIETVSARSLDRSELVKILSQQNRSFQCGVRTLANIDLLLNDNTVAVVTGQQVGLFTGPLYTLYKALTAVGLCEDLKKAYPDHSFVPIFWVEGEDHDFEEVSQVNVLTATNEYATFRYVPDERLAGKNLGASGKVEFTATIDAFLTDIRASLPATDFTEQAFDLLRAATQPGMTFARSFIHLMNVFMEESGLIFIDPNATDVKQLLKPVFEKEITEASEACRLVIERSELLEERYHAQVKPKSVNAFLFTEKGRFAIEPHPDGFMLKGIRKHFDKAGLLSLLDSQPEAFSPNVVLRPICQDTLLPTVAYVAGPSEIAYMAQIQPLYERYGIPAPIIYPRASATIIEEKVEKVLQRFDVQPLELFRDAESIRTRIAASVSDFKADELFTSTVGSVEESINSLRSGILSIDKTLEGPIDATLSKITSAIDVLKQKTVAAQKRQHETHLRQIDKALLHLAPNQVPQERSLSIIYFLNKYGPDIVRWLSGELRADVHAHQLIRL